MAMTKALGGEASWNFRDVAADAFGTALGNSIVKGLSAQSTTEKVTKQVQEIKSSSMSPEQQQQAIQNVYEEQGVVFGAADNGGGSSGGGDGGGAEDLTQKSYIDGSFDDKGNLTLNRIVDGQSQGQMTAGFSQLDSSDYAQLGRVHSSILDFAGGLLSTNAGLMDISADLYSRRFNTQSAIQKMSSQYAYEEGVTRGFHNARIGRQQTINYVKSQGFMSDYMSQADWAQAMARPDSFVSDMSGVEKFFMNTGIGFVNGISATFEGLASITGLRGEEAFVDSWTGIGNFIANPIDSTVSAAQGAYHHFRNVYQREGLGAALGEGFGMFLGGIPTAMLGGPAAGRLGGLGGNWAARGGAYVSRAYGATVSVANATIDGLQLAGKNFMAWRAANAANAIPLGPMAKQMGMLNLGGAKVRPLSGMNRTSSAGRVSPSDFGALSISQNQRVLSMWTDSMKHLATANTKAGAKYRAYLDAMGTGEVSKSVARKAYEEVAVQFRRRVKSAMAKGESFGDYNFERIHHWNWPIGDFPADATNATKLFPVSHNMHMDIHRAATIGPHPTKSPINPINILEDAPYSALPVDYFNRF